MKQTRVYGQERPLLEPANEAELCEQLQKATQAHQRCLPWGMGAHYDQLPQPARIDAVISLRRLSGIVEYEPAEGVITAQAGTTLAELRRACEQHGHHLSPCLPDEEQSTLGGVIAMGRSGVDRLRYGPLRNHVLGVRVADGSGVITKSGGRLVKNVTGYDLARLHTGAQGALGIIVEASLRLFPLPRVERSVFSDDSTLERCLELAWAARARNLGLLSLRLRREQQRWQWCAHLAGHASVVAAQERELLELWPDAHCESGSWARTLAQRDLVRGAAWSGPPSQLQAQGLDWERRYDGARAWIDPWIACMLWDVPSAACTDQRSSVQVELERSLKRALDPTGTLARG